LKGIPQDSKKGGVKSLLEKEEFAAYRGKKGRPGSIGERKLGWLVIEGKYCLCNEGGVDVVRERTR